MLKGSSTTQIELRSRRGSVQIRQGSSAVIALQTEQ